MSIEDAIMGGIVFKGKKDKPQEEENLKTRMMTKMVMIKTTKKTKTLTKMTKTRMMNNASDP